VGKTKILRIEKIGQRALKEATSAGPNSDAKESYLKASRELNEECGEGRVLRN